MTHNPSVPLGQQGEQIAARHLEANGYSILHRNWHCPFGELDIVARQGDTLVFVEVRTRTMRSPEEALSDAFASILAHKRDKLIKAAHAYIEAHELFDSAWRIDVIAIGFTYRGNYFIEQLEDALGW